MSPDITLGNIPNEPGFYTYVVECADGSLYTGWTTDIPRRLNSHNAGKGSRYTRTRCPVRLLAYWVFPDKQQAMQWEYALKQCSRSRKLNLIRQQLEILSQTQNTGL